MARAGLFVGAVAAVLALAAVAAWFILLRDTAEPVTVAEAVTSFRTDTEPTPGAPSPIPEGVYVYATLGYEKTDALTGVTHRYPKRSTITVTAADCGVSLLWRVLDGRSTEWIYCVTPRGWELASQDERHTFFGRTERTTYVCEDTPIKPAPTELNWAERHGGVGLAVECHLKAVLAAGFEPQRLEIEDHIPGDEIGALGHADVHIGL